VARTVLSTGASSGFGKNLAERFAARDYRVVGTSRRRTAAARGISMLQLDVRCDDSVAPRVRTVIERAGRIDTNVSERRG
jgi:NAD(P)-dependent dehydrogenase (short-subunit alcohol dehydrogenase family)